MNFPFLRRIIPQSVLDRRAERRIDDYYKSKIREARAAKDSKALEQWEGEWTAESWELEQGQRLRAQQRLFRKARRLYVPLPKLTDENSVDGVIIDDTLLDDLVAKIRKAQQEWQALWLAWVPLVSALTGLVATVVAIIALLKR